MCRIYLCIASTLLLTLVASCSQTKGGQSALNLAPLKPDEAQFDFEQIVNSFKGMYGLTQFKQQHLGFNFDEAVSTSRAEVIAARSDEEIFGAYRRFVTKFSDGHVSMSFPYSTGKIKRYKIPLLVAPFDNKFAVASFEPELQNSGITVGDELVSVDEKTPAQWLPLINRYMTWGNELSDRNNILILFSRDSFQIELVPQKKEADVKLRRADGSEYNVSLAWHIEPYYQKDDVIAQNSINRQGALAYSGNADRMNEVAGQTSFKLGSAKPYFTTPIVTGNFALSEVEIDPQYRTKYGLDPSKSKYDEIYAATYMYAGKKFLLVRQANYNISKDAQGADLINVYRAIFDQYEDQVVALVLDQNHNPGGYLEYLTRFFKLFITQPTANFIEAPNADRRWVIDLLENAKSIDPTMKNPEAARIAGYASAVETANDKGDKLAPFITWSEGWYLAPDDKVTWKKPILMLVDELSASCGDLLPVMMSRSHRAKLFGRRTAGLGGNVDEVATLTYSGAKLNLTRGLFNTYRQDESYTDDTWIENRGIEPDYTYVTTLDDLRADFCTLFYEDE